jgi:hypothetical protein
MDADDVCLPWRFALHVPVLRGRRVDLLFSPVVAFRADPLRIRPPLPLPITASAMPLHLLVTNLLCHPSMIATRLALDEAGGYRSLVTEDYDLWLRAAAGRLRLARASLPVIAYRHHSGQVSATGEFHGRARAQPEIWEAYRGLVQTELGLERSAIPSGWADPIYKSWRSRVLRPALLQRAEVLTPVQRRLVQRVVRLIPPTE